MCHLIGNHPDCPTLGRNPPMTIVTSTITPGLLVSLKTSCRGNVKYDRIDLEDGRDISKWETTRTISDPDEFERAKKAQSKASSIIRSVCSASAFGLLCPEAQAWKLEDAIAEAHRVVDAFNSTAELTRVNVYVIAGKVASDDVEAVKAINSEVRDLIDRLQEGVANADVAVIRQTANKAREIGNVLTPEAQVRIQFAIDAARKVAKDIVKAGEGAAIEIDQLAIRRIAEQRTAFLDIDQTAVAAPQIAGRTVEIDEPTISDEALDKLGGAFPARRG